MVLNLRGARGRRFSRNRSAVVVGSLNQKPESQIPPALPGADSSAPVEDSMYFGRPIRDGPDSDRRSDIEESHELAELGKP